jgi:ComF family protein
VLSRALRELRDGFISLAYPQECQICDAPIRSWDDGVACARCWEDPAVTPLYIETAVCAKCGAPFSANQPTPSERLCGRCETMEYAAARSCGQYAGALKACILFLKSHPHLCARLRRVIAETALKQSDLLVSDVLMPVPLHSARARGRGFNQAEVIARLLSSVYRRTVDTRSLVRVKPTDLHRAGMDSADRAKSLVSAFEVRRPPLIEGASVLLIDDLYTTGSTARAAARALVEAGAVRVNVFSIARVLPARSPSTIP